MRVLAALLMATLALPSHGNPYADAENLDQAFGIVFTARVANNYARLRCTQWYPEIKSAIDRHYYNWETINAGEISAIDRLSESFHAGYMTGLRASSAMFVASTFEEKASESPDRRAFCNYAANQMSGEFGEIRDTTPKASELLLEYLADNPWSELESHDRDSEIGCVKHGLNAGGDLDVLLAACGCMRDAMVEEMTEAEREEYYRTLLGGDANAARAMLQVRSLEQRLERCWQESAPAN